MSEILLDIRQLTHYFKLTKKTAIRALDGVSLQIKRGEVFGLVGESGSGKSTLARCIMNMEKPSGGQIFYNGIEISRPSLFRENRKMLCACRQMIFQDSDSALNPRMRLWNIVTEPFTIQNKKPERGGLRSEAAFWLEQVGMDAEYLDSYPTELSGGQRQRAAIARSLSMKPELLVADEPIASLDVSIQAQIVNLFKKLQKEQGFTLLFIAHDLAMVEYLCDRVGVLYQGKLVELAPVKMLFEDPRHLYTKALLSAMPVPDPLKERNRKRFVYQPEDNWREGSFRECEPGHFVLEG